MILLKKHMTSDDERRTATDETDGRDGTGIDVIRTRYAGFIRFGIDGRRRNRKVEARSTTLRRLATRRRRSVKMECVFNKPRNVGTQHP